MNRKTSACVVAGLLGRRLGAKSQAIGGTRGLAFCHWASRFFSVLPSKASRAFAGFGEGVVFGQYGPPGQARPATSAPGAFFSASVRAHFLAVFQILAARRWLPIQPERE